MHLHKLLGVMLGCLLLGSTAFAGGQFGLSGLQCQTSHTVLPHPLGFGLFLQKDLSSVTTLRFDYSWANETDRYVATVDRNAGYSPGTDTVRDFWLQDASMQVFESSLILKAVRSDYISFSVGPGLGLAKFNRSVVGRSTNFEWGGNSDFRLSFSVVADFEVAHPRLNPLILHLSVRERITAASAVTTTDSPAPFRDSITSATIGLAIAYSLN